MYAKRPRTLLTFLVCLVLPAMAVDSHATGVSKTFSWDYDNDEEFGTSVSISGNYAIVGTPYDNSLGTKAGSVSIFQRGSADWEEEIITCPSLQTAGDRCGYSVAIDGTTAVVGCPEADAGGLDRSGKVIILKRTGTTWQCEDELTPTDPSSRDFFGRAVSIDGSTIAVAAPYWDGTYLDQGAVYVFRANPFIIGSSWTQRKRVLADSPGQGDKFGWDIDLDWPNLIAGAPYNDDDGNNAGVAYIFELATSFFLPNSLTVTSQGDFHSRYPTADSLFGYSVAISDSTAAAGAPYYSVINPYENIEDIKVGLVTLFEPGSAGWSRTTSVSSDNRQDYQNFGMSLAITEDRLLVGAWQYAGGGAVFSHYRYNKYLWPRSEKFKHVRGTSGDRLGWSVAIDEHLSRVRGIAGAPGDHWDYDNSAYDLGSAVFFENLEETIFVDVGVVVNNADYTIYNHEINKLIEESSWFLSPRTEVRARLHRIDRINCAAGCTLTPTNMIDNYYLANTANPPDYVIVFTETASAVSSGGHTALSSPSVDLVAAGTCNDFESPIAALGRKKIYGAVIDWTHRFGTCGYDIDHYKNTLQWNRVSTVSLDDGSCRGQAGIPCVYNSNVGYYVCSTTDSENPKLFQAKSFHANIVVHELMHHFGLNGNMDHFQTPTCDSVMGGTSYHYELGTHTSTLYTTMCPYTFDNFADGYSLSCP